MNKLLAMLLSFLPLKSEATHDVLVAYQQLQKNEAIFVDVREKDEVEEGMIKGATWFPLSKISNNANWLKGFKDISADKKIYLYCRSGNRSGKVQNILMKHGINAKNIGGYEVLKKDLPSQNL